MRSSLKGRFFNRFCILFCCQYYTFFKALKNRIKHIEKETSLRSLPRKDIYNQSLFRKEFMMFLPKVMDRVIYYDELKNTEIRLKLLNKYFAKHPYLSNFKMGLELKREHEKKGPKNAKNKNDKKSKFLAQKFFKKLLKSALGLIVENMNFVIRFSLIYATCYVCSDIKDQSLYMYSFKPYDLSLLLWSLITFIMPLTFETELFLIRFALNVSFPTFLLGMFSRLFVIFYRKEKGLPTNYEKMESMKTTRMLTFFILLSYTCLHIIKANKRAQDTKIARWYQEK